MSDKLEINKVAKPPVAAERKLYKLGQRFKRSGHILTLIRVSSVGATLIRDGSFELWTWETVPLVWNVGFGVYADEFHKRFHADTYVPI